MPHVNCSCRFTISGCHTLFYNLTLWNLLFESWPPLNFWLHYTPWYRVLSYLAYDHWGDLSCVSLTWNVIKSELPKWPTSLLQSGRQRQQRGNGLKCHPDPALLGPRVLHKLRRSDAIFWLRPVLHAGAEMMSWFRSTIVLRFGSWSESGVFCACSVVEETVVLRFAALCLHLWMCLRLFMWLFSWERQQMYRSCSIDFYTLKGETIWRIQAIQCIQTQ